MKTMSVEEIDSVILTDINPSVFYEALVNIRDTAHFFAYSSLMDKKQEKPKIDSLCAAFTELYAIAQGEYVSKNDVKQLFVDEVWGDLEGYINGDGHLLEEALEKLPTIGTKGA